MANKTLFNSTEKSNFILNMTEEKYSSLASKALFLSFIISSLFSIPYYFNGKNPTLLVCGLIICGVIAMIFALIAVLKKYITKKMYLPIGAFGFMVVWGIGSLINSFEYNVAFYGMNGRGEGFLALLFYFCMFITAMTIKGKKPLETVHNGLIATGLMNAVFALIQLLSDSESNFYRKVPMTTLEKNTDGKLGSTGEPIMAVSGLAHSPIFLAMLLAFALIAALIGVILSESKIRRILCGISAIFMSFIMVFTYSLVGWVGFISAIIISLVVLFAKKAPKIRLIPILATIASYVISIVIISNGVGGVYSNYNLHDGPIMWRDSWMRIDSSGGYRSVEQKDKYENNSDLDTSKLDDAKYIYGYMNKKTIDIIKTYPIFGTGPDNLVFAQVYEDYKLPNGGIKISGDTGNNNEGTFDKCYNEFLYIAATRGVPSIIAFLVLLGSIIFVAVKNIKSKKCGNNIIVGVGIAIGGIMMFFVGTSSIVFAPIFWSFAGICVGGEEKN